MTSVLKTFSSSEVISTPWRTFSTQNTWPDFRMEEYRWPSVRIPARKHERHMLSFNMGMPLHLSWRSENRWKECECNTGNVAGLLSAGQQEEVLWEEEFHAFTLSLEPSYVDRLMDTSNFSFKEQRNLNDPFLTRIARLLYNQIQSGNEYEKIYVESLITTCTIHLATHYSATGKKIFAPKGKLSSGQLKEVIEYVRACIHGNVSLTELASCVHLSPFHFSRLFRQTVGISPYQYVLQLKIEHAKKMIKQYNGSLSEIAYNLSFTDQAHFSNVFKKVTGICPREFSRLTA